MPVHLQELRAVFTISTLFGRGEKAWSCFYSLARLFLSLYLALSFFLVRHERNP